MHEDENSFENKNTVLQNLNSIKLDDSQKGDEENLLKQSKIENSVNFESFSDIIDKKKPKTFLIKPIKNYSNISVFKNKDGLQSGRKFLFSFHCQVIKNYR